MLSSKLPSTSLAYSFTWNQRASIPSKPSTNIATIIYTMASLKFDSQIASRVKNPHTAPVPVNRCTLHASVFLSQSGSFSNINHLIESYLYIIREKAHLAPRLSNLFFHQPNLDCFAIKGVFDNESFLRRTSKHQIGCERFGCDVILVRFNCGPQAC